MGNKILLVEPNFPYPNKSKHKANSTHKNFVPISLLKLGAYHKFKGDKVKLVRGEKSKKGLGYYEPDKILITSLFTYWSKHFWDSVAYYRKLFPRSEILTGGIYVTLHHNTEIFKSKARKFRIKYHIGLHKEAEKFLPDYSLLEGEICPYHATHNMRGCIRRCSFCGVWRIEPKLYYKSLENIKEETNKINKNKVVFFDNNFLAHPNIKEILRELAELRLNKRPVLFESQSGFDGRILEKYSELANMIKRARFQNVRIAWDNSVEDKNSIKKQVNYLIKAGYPAKEITVFMIYNFDMPYRDMLKKLKYCEKLGVQIADCRYRPLESTYDNYSPHAYNKGQTSDDYYIHTSAGWTDKKIRDFRRRVRIHNIWIRYAKDKGNSYNKKMEKWSAINNTFKFFNLGKPPKIEFIESSITWKERIKLMNKVKKIYKNKGYKYIDLSSYRMNNLDIKLKNLEDYASNFD